jgi:hypothetical protein
MPGCTAFVSIDAVDLLLGAGTRASWSMSIPAAPNLLGSRFHQQALVVDPLAGNASGAVVSDAATAVVGH